MHPAYSVLFFTTLSGAGYGLFIWLGMGLLFNVLSPGQWVGYIMLVLGGVLVTAGLLTSTLHLGRPERAIKAFSQWRTSWLSREGVAAIATYLPAVALGLSWLVLEPGGLVVGGLAVVLILTSLVTLWCTGQIYASLTTIQAWSHPLVPWGYVLLGLATGGLLYVAVSIFAQRLGTTEILFVLTMLLAAWALKTAYWGGIDTADRSLTPADAIGLPGMGKVRVLEPAHTQPNYVMREMGYRVARDHARRLRQLCVLALFVVPVIVLLLLLVAPPSIGVFLALVGVLAAAAGVFVERWLFFAEAQHIVTLYYGAERA